MEVKKSLYELRKPCGTSPSIGMLCNYGQWRTMTQKGLLMERTFQKWKFGSPKHQSSTSYNHVTRLKFHECILLILLWIHLSICKHIYYGEGNGTPLQYSCLENPMDGEDWWAAVHGVAKSQTRLHFYFSLSCIGEGNGNPLQCSCLENPRDGGAWWAAVCGVLQSRTRLKWLSSSSSSQHILSKNTFSFISYSFIM